MGLSGPNPGLAHALTNDLASQERAAQEHQAIEERARLDAAELRALERAGLRGEAPVREGGQMRIGLVGAMVIAAAVSVACQSGSVSPQVQTGRADAAEGAISISTSDWTYSVPLDGVVWIDEAGSRHDSGRPECLAPGVSRQIRFAAVETTIEEATWRPVVWVSCQ